MTAKDESKIFEHGSRCAIPLFLLLCGSLLSSAQANTINCAQTDDACWRAQYKKLCSYDGNMCKRLVNNDGSWIQPSWEVKESLKVLAPNIRQASKEFGVDPRAIASAVFTENSINFTIRHNLEDFLVKYKIGVGNGKIPILDRSFSFGWGQLYIDAAMQAEPEVAKVEGRQKLRTSDEIAQQLLVPEEAMKYIAGYMKLAQEKYAAAGYPIADKPEILASLYNLGKLDDHLAETKSSGRQPEVNFFGFFVAHYENQLTALVSTPTLTQSSSIVGNKQKNNTGPASTKPAAPVKTVQAVKSSVRVVPFPPQCPNEGSGKDAEYGKVASYQEANSAATVKAGSSYTVLAPGLGCNLAGDPEAWSLIQDQNGVTGWIKDSNLKKVTGQVVRAQAACPTSDSSNNACIKSLRAEAKDDFLKIDPKEGITISLSKQPGMSGAPNWQQGASYSCQLNQPAQNQGSTGFFNTPNGSFSSPTHLLTQAELKTIFRQFDDFRARLKSSLGMTDDQLNSNADPYAQLLTAYGSLATDLTNLKSCVASDAKPAQKFCYADPKSFDALETIPVPKKPTFQQWSAVMASAKVMYGLGNPIAQPGDSDEAKKAAEAKKRTLLKKLDDCRDVTAQLPDSKAYLDKIIGSTDQMIAAGNIQDSDFDQLTVDCKFMKTGVLENIGCPGCASADTLYVQGVPVQVDVLKTMLTDPKDKDAFLLSLFKNQISDYKFSQNTSSSSQYTCPSYDPIATAERIQRLLKLDCVETVFVPDPWLINKLGRSQKVVVRPFLEDDHFSVQIRTNHCGGIQ